VSSRRLVRKRPKRPNLKGKSPRLWNKDGPLKEKLSDCLKSSCMCEAKCMKWKYLLYLFYFVSFWGRLKK
jgi:hypothetical protein